VASISRMNNSGLLSIDFIAGFTIFMIAFIAVATLVSGLLVGLQSKTIDYDAVAYRTGVILVEDPGSGIDKNIPPNKDNHTTSWEFISDSDAHLDVLRYGLALSKDYPNILMDHKVEQFFSNPSYTPYDYHTKALFDVKPGSTDSPLYKYSIQLLSFESSPTYRLSLPPGENLPENVNVGYIHRVVKIKPPTSAAINASNRNVPVDPSAAPLLPWDEFIVYFDFPKIYSENPLYRIDPFGENISINIKNLDTTESPTNPGWVAGTKPILQEVRFYIDKSPNLQNIAGDTPVGVPISIVYDGTTKTPPFEIDPGKDISLKLTPDFFVGRDMEKNRQYYLKFTFSSNTTNLRDSHNYDQDNPEVTIPPLVPALMEVRVW
jgi:hypothetical protein